MLYSFASILWKIGALEDQIGKFYTTTKLSCIVVKLRSHELSFSYLKCLGPESLQISDFFRFQTICIYRIKYCSVKSKSKYKIHFHVSQKSHRKCTKIILYNKCFECMYLCFHFDTEVRCKMFLLLQQVSVQTVLYFRAFQVWVFLLKDASANPCDP